MCDGTWAYVDGVGLYADYDEGNSYAHWFGPILLHKEGEQWVGVSSYLFPFDCGISCDGYNIHLTNPQRCQQAPVDLRARMDCL